MKKLIAMSALCLAGMVFAQEPEAPAPEAAPAEPPKCECGAGKPCECAKPCKCGGERKGPRGEFRRPGGMQGQHGQRRPGMHGPHGRQMPKFKKCECCPECKGVIILPPDSQEGEPLFKLFKGEGRGPAPEMKGCPGKPGCPEMKGCPDKPACPEKKCCPGKPGCPEGAAPAEPAND